MLKLDRWKQAFQNEKDYYVIIGGTALRLIAESQAKSARATRDIDVIVLVKNGTERFIRKLIAFAKEGGYREVGNSPDFSAYRFTHPQDSSYPDQIELFCKDEAGINLLKAHLEHYALASRTSFSAVLLEEPYYEMLKANVIQGNLAYASAEALIPLKAKAYLSNRALYEKKTSGIDKKDYQKHARDIWYLLSLSEKHPPLKLDPQIANDLRDFIKESADEPIDYPALYGFDREALVAQLKENYSL